MLREELSAVRSTLRETPRLGSMDPSRPTYNGVYGRLFISPTLVIGLGRWGAHVCSRFFKEMAGTLVPTARGIGLRGGVSLNTCFGTLACVRDMDRETTPLHWAEIIRSWPPCLDDLTDGAFLILTLTSLPLPSGVHRARHLSVRSNRY